MIVTGPLLPLLCLVAPLSIGLLVALPVVRPHATNLLPLAPVPALIVAVAFASDGRDHLATLAPDILLGVTLGLDARSALLLGVTAFLWIMAGLYAVAYMRGTHHPAVFAGFWCLTLAGNLGVFLARDVATFYVAFAAVSLASYILVVHDGTPRALRAGRVYIALAICGEASLLAGFLIGVESAGSLLIDDISSALPGSPWRHPATALLVVGFGIKAGLMPLHVWLPLAHPAAPTPASAVLSGAIVKAGIFGLMLFLPGGMPDGGAVWGEALLLAGFASAFIGAAVGLTQTDPKSVLAYSTISQMGLVTAVIGAGATAADVGAGHPVAAFYAAHHGLAKGALFLAVGVIAASGPRHRPFALAVATVTALSVAGLPVTGGGLAKAALKAPLGAGPATLLATMSAIVTALLLMRFLALVARSHVNEDAGRKPGCPAAMLLLPWLATSCAALVLPWLVLPSFTDMAREDAFAPSVLWSSLWPLGVAAAAGLIWTRLRLRGLRLPEGDIVVPVESAVRKLLAAGGARFRSRPGRPPGLLQLRCRTAVICRIDGALTRFSVAGVAVAAFAMLLMAALNR